jgi:hypothetical protein
VIYTRPHDALLFDRAFFPWLNSHFACVCLQQFLAPPQAYERLQRLYSSLPVNVGHMTLRPRCHEWDRERHSDGVYIIAEYCGLHLSVSETMWQPYVQHVL